MQCKPGSIGCPMPWACAGKLWSTLSGSTHFLTRTLKRVRTEMSLHVLAYNMKRVIAIIGVGPLLQAIRA